MQLPVAAGDDLPAGGPLDGAGGPLQQRAVPFLRLPGRELAYPPGCHAARFARLGEQLVDHVLPLPLPLVLVLGEQLVGHWLLLVLDAVRAHWQDGHVRHAR
ncbi:hypothetical protein [Kitasatospora aureofaciens]|uniref:hypothetical protein n=1 Tax=Kitasatospora aureofaciens TaxID=1894 RepID=UPI003811482E